MVTFSKIILQIVIIFTVGSVHAAGQIDLVEGQVRITNGQGELRIPLRGGRVEAGDVVATGQGGEIHIITDDNGLLALRSNTTLIIDAYRAAGGQDDKVALRLLRGTFRSITGWIGKINPNNYQVHTASATIGIRGTDHEPLVVEAGSEAGTYDKVNRGRALLETPAGKIEIGPNQAGFVRWGETQAPALLAKIPALYKPSRHENVIEKTRDRLEQSLDEKLKEKQRKGEDGKPGMADSGIGKFGSGEPGSSGGIGGAPGGIGSPAGMNPGMVGPAGGGPGVGLPGQNVMIPTGGMVSPLRP